MITYISLAQSSFGQDFIFDHTVLDLRDIEVSSKPVKGTFTVTNTGREDLLILSVMSTCGCTTVDWTRTPVHPGRTAQINIQYSHNGGPGPFEKTVMVQFAGLDGKVNLKVIGEAFETETSEVSGTSGSIGPLKIRSVRLNAGDITPGERKKGYATVFNTSSKDVSLSFTGLTRRMEVTVEPAVIPAGGKGRIWYTVTTSGYDAGYMEFTPVPVIDGQKMSPIIIYASAHHAGARAKAGVDAKIKDAAKEGHTYSNTFTVTNTGNADLVIKKITSVSSKGSEIKAESHSRIIAPGQSTEVAVTGKFKRKGFLDTVSIFTNDPDHPEIRMFVIDSSDKGR